MIWSLLVGALIGAIAGAITKYGVSMVWVTNFIAGLLGAWVGQALFGHWGPSLAGMALVPSIIGAVIVVLVASLIFGKNKK